MVEFAHILREQYIQCLYSVYYKGIVVPVKDEVMYGQGARYPEFEAYIILTNQTSNQGFSNKCTENYLATIQVDIVTKFAANSGAKLPSEEISALVLAKVGSWPFNTKSKNIITQKAVLETNRGLREDSDVHRIYRKILIFTHNINE